MVVVWLGIDTCPDDIASFSPRGVAYSTNPLGVFGTTELADTRFVRWDDAAMATRLILAYDTRLPPLPSANGSVAFGDANFQRILDSAYGNSFYTGVPADAMDCGDDTPSPNEIDSGFREPIPSSTAVPEPELEATGTFR
ncbi:hypothetical protein CORC01_06393 [Colletotrichum orchidophilum]|uniref:Uncharacterized protein n=1 Tax=Colletotrichum orchidophilum TaxID=1209926 RepID=A0A1G4BAG0_9PEZI|nr:uncharacterized protein CORC01_06393 [Colletotrichum orchidophilum]OHE98397.1 hypothetical protein CORC01_06393 [Colletotrichum orchidophilum]